MLFTQGPEPHLHALLRSAATALCPLSLAVGGCSGGPTDPKSLLPRLDKKPGEACLPPDVPLALGGTLGEAGGGLLLLGSAGLTTKAALGLAQGLRAGEASLMPGFPELTVPLTASLWSEVCACDLGRGTEGRPPAEAVIAKFGLPFFAEHDIVFHRPPRENDEDLMVDWLLAESSSSSNNGGDTARADAGAALATRLAAARAAPPPRLSDEAMAALHTYFSMQRAQEHVGAGLLGSLCRLASACARLCNRPAVLPFPDAALAVALAEERAAAIGMSPALWPRWAHELEHGTELSVCLSGLLDDVVRLGGLTLGSCDQEGGYDWNRVEE